MANVFVERAKKNEIYDWDKKKKTIIENKESKSKFNNLGVQGKNSPALVTVPKTTDVNFDITQGPRNNVAYQKQFIIKANEDKKRDEYNQKRAYNPSLPEFGSFEYYTEQEKEVGQKLDSFLSSQTKSNNPRAFRERGLSKPYNEVDITKEQAESIAKEYGNILIELAKHTKGVNLNEDGSIDFQSGIEENRSLAFKFDKLNDYYKWAGKQNPHSHRGYVIPEYREKSKETTGQIQLHQSKSDAYKYAEKHYDNTYNDNLGGWIAGNYRTGDINERIGKAGYKAFANKTDDMEAVEVYQKLQDNIVNNSKATFNNENSEFKQSVASISGYAPQFINQTIAQIPGAIVGGLIGYAVGNVVEGVRIGSAATSGLYMYEQTAGQEYVKNLQENKLDINDAKVLANNTAVASGLVEFGLEWGLSKLWKGGKAVKNVITKTGKEVIEEPVKDTASKIVKGLVKRGMSEKGAKIAVESAKNVGKLFLNSFGEGSEEWLQSGMEITSSKYAKQGKILNVFEIFEKSLDFSHYTKEELGMMNDSFKAGMVIGIFSGGVKAATFGTANKIAETVNNKDMGNTIKDLSFSGEVIKKAVDYAKTSGVEENIRLASQIEEKDIKDISSETLGKLAKNAIKDGVNIFKLNETTAENNSTSVELSKDISEYPYDMQTVIKDYVEYGNPRIREFINNVIQGTAGKRIYLENVTSRAVGKIKELLNLNVENYKVSLDKNIVEHIIKRHGKDGLADKSMADISDFERIQYVLNNFDNIEYGGKSSAFTTIDENGNTRLADTVIYSKKINGTFYVVQAVPETKNKTLRIVSAYINKNGVSQVSNSITPEETSKTPTANTPINNSLSQPDNTVNNSYMQNSQNDTETRKIISSLSRVMGGAVISETNIKALIANPEIFEIYSGVEIKGNAETTIRNYLETKRKENSRANSIIAAISDKTGLAFEYDVTLPVEIAGFYDARNKKIVLNPAHKKALDYAVVHELTHFVENKKGYGAYRKSLLKSNAYQEFLIENNYADEKEFRTQLEKDYKEVYSNLSKEEFNEAIDYEIAGKISEYLINSEPAALKRLANKDTGIKAVFRDIMEFFEEIIHKLSGNSEKAYAMKMARKFRELAGDNDVVKGKDYIRYSIHNIKGFGDIVFLDKKLINASSFNSHKEAIKKFFVDNLKDKEITILESKDVVNIDQIGKYLYPGEKVERYSEKLTAIEILSDIVKIGRNKKHSKDLIVDGKIKNHAGYDASNGWDYYETHFCLDNTGIVYGGTVVVRKSKNGKDYFYDLNNIREVGYQDELKNYPVKYGQTSLEDNIPHKKPIVNNNSMQDTKKYSITKDSGTSESKTVEKFEAQNRTMLISRNDSVSKIEDIRHKVSQKIFKEFSIPVNQRTELKSLINSALKKVEQGNTPSDVITSSLFNLLEKNSKVVDDSIYNEYKELKELIKTTKLHFSEEVRRDFPEAESFRRANMGRLLLNHNEGRGIDDFYQELCNSYPDVFSDEVINSADQLREISDVIKSISKENMSVIEAGEKEGLTREYFEGILKSAFDEYFISNFENEVRKGSDKITNKQKHKYIELKSGRPYSELTELEMNDYNSKLNKEIENFKNDKDIDTVEKILNMVDKKSNNIIDTTEYIELFEDVPDIDSYTLENFQTVPAQFIKGNQLGMTFDGKDIYRNNDMVSNKSKVVRNWLGNLIERPLEDAKGDYVDRLKDKVNYVYNTIVKDLGIKMGSKESAAVQWYGEGVKPQKKGTPVSYTLQDLKTEFPEKWEDIVKADKLLRKMYNDYIDEINTVLKQIYPNVEKDVEKLQKSIDTLNEKKDSLDKETRKKANEKIKELEERIDNLYTNRRLRPRKDYYRHFQEQGGGVSSLMNILKTDIQISPDLIKISENTKPLTKWWGALQHRQGDKNYKADGVGAILNYIPNAEYKINIEPFIGHMRKVINSFIKDTTLTKNANGYIQFLIEWTNDLAGKTNASDRSVQNKLSRKIMNVVGWVGGRARANAIVGNLRTAVVQVFNLPNAAMYIKNPLDWGNGIKTMVLDIKSGNNIINQSVFLKERYLDDVFSKFKKGIKYTPAKLCNLMLTAGDKAATTYIWYSAYSEGVRKKLENPVLYADRTTRRSVAGRGIGELPLMQKSKVIQAIAPFQVEVANTWEIMKEKGKQGDLIAFLLYSASAWALNSLAELVFGDKVIPDIVDIISDMIDKFKDDEPIHKNIGQATLRASGGIMSSMPYASVIASAVIPDEELRGEIFGDDDPSRYGVGVFGLEQITNMVAKTIAGTIEEDDIVDFAASYLLPYGGKQIARTYKGVKDISAGGSYTNKGQLRFPITTAGDKTKTLMFGAYSTKKGQEYLEKLKPLGDKQTKIFKQMLNLHNGRKYQDEIFYTFKGYSEYKKQLGKTILSKKEREKYVNTMSPLHDMPDSQHIRVWFINNVDSQEKNK